MVRCLSVAVALKQIGHHITFASQELPGNCLHLVRAEGIAVIPVDPEGLPTSSYLFDVAVVDHYPLTEVYEKKLRKHAQKLIAIDDWGTRTHAVDLIVDPSISSQTKLRKAANSQTPFFSGAEWVLLRSEFLELRRWAKPRTQFQSILVFFGGTDPADQTLPYLDAVIAEPELSKYSFTFLIPGTHFRIEEIKARTLPKNIHLAISPPSVAKLMAESEVYVGSAGTVTWERMSLGLTGAVISVVDNQEDLSQTLADQGLHEYWGKSSETSPTDNLNRLKVLLQKSDTLRMRSKAAYEMIDAEGVGRFVQKIIELGRT